MQEETINKPYRSPVYNVIAVPISKVKANAYNPNTVFSVEMKLLHLSITEDGYTMPCVCYFLIESGTFELEEREGIKYFTGTGEFELVDGFHRYLTLLNNSNISERENNFLPVSVIDKDITNRMASTIRHNRARGVHSIELMSNIVSDLVGAGMSDAWILRHIGMDKDELLRLKQITGLAALFINKEFSQAWEHPTPEPIELEEYATED